MAFAISDQLRAASEEAIAQGASFLTSEVRSDGGWPSDKHSLDEEPEIEFSVFVVASGALVLESVRDQRIEDIRTRSKQFILSRIGPQGLWSYIPGLHPDLDDTSMCSMVAGPSSHAALFMGRNLQPVLSNLDEEGRFLTWIRPPGMPNDTDSVVNANVISWLGDRVETRAAQAWIERLIKDGQENGTSLWYPQVMDLYYCVSRASYLATPVFANLRNVLARRILQSKPENVLQKAQAVSALRLLQCDDDQQFIRRLLNEVIELQRNDGSWPSCEVWRGPADLGYVFWSSALTSAYCIEALSRSAKVKVESDHNDSGS